MSYVRIDRGNYYLKEKYKDENGKWKERTLFCFGKIPPKRYNPLIFYGDATEKIGEISSSKVSLVVTSPPYWQIKDYGKFEQIGKHQGYGEYIKSLKEIWRHCHRVLENGRRLCINIGDQFTSTEEYGKHVAIPIHADIIVSCVELGFDYMGSIIWDKFSTTRPSGGASVMGSYPYPPNALVEYNYEFIMIFKKRGKVKLPQHPQIKLASKLKKEEWFKYCDGKWKFPGVKQDSHIAMFPLELPKRLIKMFSYVGDIVLDPFVGSGTTLISAMGEGRQSIGIEINKEYKKIIDGGVMRGKEKASKNYSWVDTKIEGD